MELNKQAKTLIFINAALKGSQIAYSKIMDLYWNNVITHLKKNIAQEVLLEDIALIAFTKAFEKLETYNKDYSFNTWLLTITSNSMIDFLRSQKKRSLSIDEIFYNDLGKEFYTDIKSKELSPEELLTINQEEKKLIALINNLPKQYSSVVNMRYLQHMSYKEISKTLDLSISNVKIKIMRGRKLLIKTLEKHEDFN